MKGLFRTVRSRAIAAFVLTLFAVTGLGAQDYQVDREELQSFGDQSIKFINYVGPHEFINTLDQIRGIGRALGVPIDPGTSGRSDIGGKYRILHIVSPEIPTGLDADVFILESGAAVDHIRNLRLILAGYLEEAYGYGSRDAFLLAEFVTYYNAVHRGDMDYVGGVYKEPVVDVLDPSKVGLDTHYAQWAGKTQALIPVRGAGSPAGPVVDTGAITEEEVIDEMRKEEDRGIESRKDMVELREEEIDEEQSLLDEEREALEEREERIDEEIAELEEKPPEERTAKEEEKIEALEEEKAAVEEEKTAVETEQKELDQRTEDTLRMRDEIAEDENELLTEGTAEPAGFVSAPRVDPVWFLLVDDMGDGIPFGRVVKYDRETGNRMAVSGVTAVRGRTLVILPDSLLVIAGKDSGNARVRPILLNRDTLETTREGSDDVFPGSLMTVKGSDIYLVTTESGSWRLGKFNTALERTAVSESIIEPWTSIAFQGDSLYVQGAGGEILALDPGTLATKTEFE